MNPAIVNGLLRTSGGKALYQSAKEVGRTFIEQHFNDEIEEEIKVEPEIHENEDTKEEQAEKDDNSENKDHQEEPENKKSFADKYLEEKERTSEKWQGKALGEPDEKVNLKGKKQILDRGPDEKPVKEIIENGPKDAKQDLIEKGPIDNWRQKNLQERESKDNDDLDDNSSNNFETEQEFEVVRGKFVQPKDERILEILNNGIPMENIEFESAEMEIGHDGDMGSDGGDGGSMGGGDGGGE